MLLIAYFFIYAFGGWLLEVGYHFLKHRRFVNRGFLYGPFVPLYGVSASVLHLLLRQILPQISSFTPLSIVIVFATIVIVTTFFELVSGLTLLKLFGIRWWDYSEERFQYTGVVCLRFALVWGLLGTLLYFGVHLPLVVASVAAVPKHVLNPVVGVLMALIVIDIIFTVRALIGFKALVREFRLKTKIIEHKLFDMRASLPAALKNHWQRIRRAVADYVPLKAAFIRLEQLKSGLAKVKDHALNRDFEKLRHVTNLIRRQRLFKAFPELKIPVEDGKTEKDEDNATS